MVRHRSFRRPRASPSLPDVGLLEGVVHPTVVNAMRVASAQLRAAGIRHALAGALALGAHGYPRATKDVDFLVGDEAFRHHDGGIVTIAPGVPIAVGDVAVDPLSIAAGEKHLDDAISRAVGDDVPVLPLAPLIYLKLKSPRRRDAADVIELLKQGVDPAPVLAYLDRHASDMKQKFLDLVATAASEEP